MGFGGKAQRAICSSLPKAANPNRDVEPSGWCASGVRIGELQGEVESAAGQAFIQGRHRDLLDDSVLI